MPRLTATDGAPREVASTVVRLVLVLLGCFACGRAAPREDPGPTGAMPAEQEADSTWTGSFHLLWGDPAPGAPGTAQRRYQLVTDRGEVMTLLVEDSLLAHLGGASGLAGKRLTIGGTRGGTTGPVRVRSVRVAP